MYIHELLDEPKRKLCKILDKDNKWLELGGVHMKYDVTDLEEIKRSVKEGSSITSELLTVWSHQNHTVLELFVLLGRMKQYQAMMVLKELVDKKYHVLIKDSVDELNPLVRQMLLEKKKIKNVDYRIHPDNYNGDPEKILNTKIIPRLPTIVSNENNESSNFLLPKSPVNFIRSKMYTASDISFVAESVGGLPSLPYEELQASTNNWSESTVLGKGGFGKVYKGTWKCTQVAIKRLDQKDKKEYETEQIKQSITELHCLNAYRHDNILPLYGYSIGGPHPCLIYQYMAGGSLDNRLRTRDPEKVLKWPTRLNIAIGVARGLQFLHTNRINGKPLVHGDIKSANILLDPCNQPRIGDFGLAREGPQSQYTYIKVSRIHGTRPYLPEEFLRAKKFSTKVDTYSFGVLLFELATSLSPHSEHREEKFLRDHVVNYPGDILELKDKRVKDYDDCFKGILEIGKMCVKRWAKERPEMIDVLIMLEKVSLVE
ncbi:serine/threonine-protein kinase pelle [Diabrotica virgifera virgifera]|uniref:non-specific serine/threonine protein kinase n=1 Tax=Diabrotica virgifera virgifera TaxID=50390 RepID=A0A6P7FXJ9_DIAVI|nr:serine/threonine-protein kinase pelle [Diabrotica virgifera virgifera]